MEPESVSRMGSRANIAALAVIVAVGIVPYLLLAFGRPDRPAASGGSGIPMDLLMGTATPAAEKAEASDLPAGMRPTDRPLLVEFYTDWCGVCRRMESETFTDPAVAKAMRDGFTVYRLNPEKDPDGGALARRLGVRAYPTIVFFDRSGREAHRVVGYRSAPAFLSVLRKVE